MSYHICIIDYGSGNLRSAAKAFEKIAHDSGLDARVDVSNKAESLNTATHIVLPGQGAFIDCMEGLSSVDGMLEALNDNVIEKAKPFLGICVGMQLLASRGMEGGVTGGLGWIEGDVVPMQPDDSNLKIPHMGWNDLVIPAPPDQDNRHFTLRAVREDTHFYFVHSYVFQCTHAHHVLAYTEYGGYQPAVVGRDNIVGVQFHPEKSHDAGLALISDFLQWKP